tara:strand:+ start:975 stop:3281 length:2307 start_codon:yes stop_codon:yes gene_type:complete
MADERFGELDPKKLRELRAEMKLFADDLNSISDQQNKALKEAGAYADGIRSNSKAGAKVLDDISKMLASNLQTQKGQQQLENKIKKLKQETLSTEIKIFTIKEKIRARLAANAKINSKEIVSLQKILQLEMGSLAALEGGADAAGKLNEEQVKLSKNTAFFDTMSDFVKDIPILNTFLSDLTKAADAAREAAAQGQSAFIAGAKSYANLLAKGTTVLTGATILKAAKQLDERQTSFERKLNMSHSAAAQLSDDLIKASKALGEGVFNAERFSQATLSINQSLGTTGKLSSDVLETFVLQTERLGLSTEEASKFSKIVMATGKNAKDLQKDILKTKIEQDSINNLAIDYKVLTKDINNISSATLLSLNSQGKSLSNAAYQARALGLSMSQMEGIADSLLDFENSIASEMEAELMTGRQLNFEKARLAAINNDMVGLAQELNKQNITAAKFGEMNRLAQASIAKSFGMSREEMGEMLVTQEALKKIGKDSLSQLEKETREKAKQVGWAKALDSIADDELKRQISASTVAEQSAQLQQKMLEQFQEGGILDSGLQGIKGAINILNDNIQILTYTMMAMSGLQLGSSLIGRGGLGGVGKIGQMFSRTKGPLASGATPTMMDKLFGYSYTGAKGKNIMSVAGKGGKLLGRAAGGLGLGIAGMGVDLARENLLDNPESGLGKGMGVGSMALTGAGIGLMFGPMGAAIGGGLGALAGAINEFVLKDEEKEENKKQTSALEGINNTLVSMQEKQGVVYIDGNAAGYSMSLNNFKVQ